MKYVEHDSNVIFMVGSDQQNINYIFYSGKITILVLSSQTSLEEPVLSSLIDVKMLRVEMKDCVEPGQTWQTEGPRCEAFFLLPLGWNCGKLNILLINIRPAMVIKIHQTKLQPEISDRKVIMRVET